RRSAFAASSPPNPAPRMTTCGRARARAASVRREVEGASMQRLRIIHRIDGAQPCGHCRGEQQYAAAGRDHMAKYVALALLGAISCAAPAQAQEVTLRGVTAFAEKTTYSRGFETFIERVNEAGKGVIRINYIGGPKAMPPFEVGNALKNGVVEIANVTGAFYTNLLPE